MRSRTFLLSTLVVMVTGLPTNTKIDDKSKTSKSASNQNEDIHLDIEKLSKLGDPGKYLTTLRQLAQALHGCGVKEVPDLKRHYIRNKTVTCNDGSPAG